MSELQSKAAFGASNSHVHSVQDNNNMLNSNNFDFHSKSQKPIEFKKIQNLSVKAGGNVVAVANIQNAHNLQSQKNLMKFNYEDVKRHLANSSESQPSIQQ
jgi:hypothetical protein